MKKRIAVVLSIRQMQVASWIKVPKRKGCPNGLSNRQGCQKKGKER